MITAVPVHGPICWVAYLSDDHDSLCLAFLQVDPALMRFSIQSEAVKRIRFKDAFFWPCLRQIETAHIFAWGLWQHAFFRPIGQDPIHSSA